MTKFSDWENNVWVDIYRTEYIIIEMKKDPRVQYKSENGNKHS